MRHAADPANRVPLVHTATLLLDCCCSGQNVPGTRARNLKRLEYRYTAAVVFSALYHDHSYDITCYDIILLRQVQKAHIIRCVMQSDFEVTAVHSSSMTYSKLTITIYESEPGLPISPCDESKVLKPCPTKKRSSGVRSEEVIN